MKAILFGSIGSVVETSELQRAAFNQAFGEFQLDWHWDQNAYRAMLAKSGGVKRIESYAASRAETVDAAAIHARKSEVFQENLAMGDLNLRPGVEQTLRAATEAELKLGFVTTTDRRTVEILRALVKDKTSVEFDVVTWRGVVSADKPDPAVYQYAIAEMGVPSALVLAIEDNVDGVSAAKSAGLTVIAFPGENTKQDDMTEADTIATDDNLYRAVFPALHSEAI